MDKTRLEGLFRLLQMPYTEDLSQVRSQLRRLMIQFHPDVHQENKLFYEEKTRTLLEAYEQIRFYLEVLNPTQQALFETEVEEPPPPPKPDLGYVQFACAHKRFAIPVSVVREVTHGRDFVPVASGDEQRIGKIAWRGSVLPVFSLSASFRQIQPTLDDRLWKAAANILVVQTSASFFGLAVERVEGVVHLPPERVQPRQSVGLGLEWVAGVAVSDDRLLLLVDSDALLKQFRGPWN